MSGWIKFDKDMAEDPRLLEAARHLLERYLVAGRSEDGKDLSKSDELRYACNALRGALVTLWCYADTHVRDDDSLPCDVTALDVIVGIEGFCDLMPDDWVTVRDDGRVTLPGYCDKNGLDSKRKKANKSAERQRRYRERLNASRGHNETRNVTRNARITLGGDLDQDLDHKEETNTTRARARLGPADEAEHHVMFERVRKAYPPFAGRQNWIQAEHYCRVRLEKGSTWSELVDAVKRYAAYVESGGVSSTAHVLTPATFFSAPDEPWRQPWTLPEAKARGQPAKPKFVPPPEDPDLVRTASA